jgi:hypothetical protein
LGYVSFVTTFDIAFVEQTEIAVDAWFVTNRIVDIFFLLDIVVNFMLGYHDPITNELVIEQEKVIAHYLRGWFPLDLVSIIPFNLVGSAGESMRLLRMFRLAKLFRILRASRILGRIVQCCSFQMSTWEFYRCFLVLVVTFHWSCCAWMFLATIEGADENWRTKIIAEDTAGTLADILPVTAGRILKSSVGGGDSSGVAGLNWYLLSGKWTLAIFGVWAFEPPEPQTRIESWFSIVMTVFAASFYAYLAGVIVELVARRGESDREINGQMDGLLRYLDAIQFPTKDREEFRRFFWLCRPYFMHKHFHQALPELSPMLFEKLAMANYGKMIGTVPFLNCSDENEKLRFVSRVGNQLKVRAYCASEQFIVDSLHLVQKGIVAWTPENGGQRRGGRSNAMQIVRRGGSFGHAQCVDERSLPQTAHALSFVACLCLDAETLSEVLRTRQFPHTQRRVHRTAAILEFRRLMVKLVAKRRAGTAKGWGAESMRQYRHGLRLLSRTSSKVERESIREHMRRQGSMRDLYSDPDPEEDKWELLLEVKAVMGNTEHDGIRSVQRMLKSILGGVTQLQLQEAPGGHILPGDRSGTAAGRGEQDQQMQQQGMNTPTTTMGELRRLMRPITHLVAQPHQNERATDNNSATKEGAQQSKLLHLILSRLDAVDARLDSIQTGNAPVSAARSHRVPTAQ